jgi:hypothetical protein
MELKDIKNELVVKVNENLNDCRRFCEKTHYSKSYGAGGRLYFSLYYQNKLVGVSIWRGPIGRSMYMLFGLDDNKSILDLSRFCLDDCMPKNTASYFLSRCIKWIKQNKNDINYLTTYADYNENHNGIIYKATNWLPFGVGGDGVRIYEIMKDGSLKLRHTRKIKGEKKEDKSKFKIIKVEEKFRYVISLRTTREEFKNNCKNYEKLLRQFTKLEEKFLQKKSSLIINE